MGKLLEQFIIMAQWKKEVWRPIIIWNINEIGSLKIKPEKLINKTEKTFSLIGCAIKTKMEVCLLARKFYL